jgi:hypothetical protein
MKGGVIGVVEGDFRVVDSFSDTVVEGDRELTRCLDIRRVFSLPSGGTAFAGRAAVEYLRRGEATEIDGDEIRVTEGPRKATRHTEFVGVPGEFVVVGSGDGRFAFELIGADTNTTIERATVDVDAFFRDRGSATPWKAGFYGTGDDAVNGVLHGADLRVDHDLDAVLRRSKLNQVGLEYRYDDRDLKMTASRSGYVEVYRPREFGAGDFLEYLLEEIVAYIE